MKTVKILQSLAERFDLPAEAAAGELRLTLVGKSRLLIENHCGILEFTDSRLVIAAQRGKAAVNGSGISIEAMNKHELLVRGIITGIERE